LRKSPLIALGVAASLGLGVGGVAIAQDNTDPGHTLDITATPTKAGKKKKPKAITLGLGIQNNRDAKTTASRIEVLFPKQFKFNLKNFPVCTEETLDPSAGEGTSACDPKSKLGTGTAGAILNPRGANPQPLNFKNTFFVGDGRKQLNIYLEQTDGDIRKLLVGKIGKAGGKYGQKLTIDIPEDLQQPLPGTYSALTDIETKLKGTAGKGKKKHGFLNSTGCKGGRWEFMTRLTYVNNPDPPSATKSEADDAIPCKK
jgi:hypothetical protein